MRATTASSSPSTTASRSHDKSGNIPGALGSLPSLAILWLGGNRLTGPVPLELGNLAALLEKEKSRFAGCEIQLKLRVPQGNQRNFSGTLVGLEEGEGAVNVCLKVDETMHRFALDNVDRARLVPKF